MKRSKLTRKTPLKRGTKGLKRTPLKKVSKKRAKENREYSQLRKEYLTANPHCYICLETFLVRPASDVHHKNQRHGKLLNETKYWLATCRSCHRWLHDNPKKARELGYLI